MHVCNTTNSIPMMLTAGPFGNLNLLQTVAAGRGRHNARGGISRGENMEF